MLHLLTVALLASASPQVDYPKLVAQAKFTLAEAIEKGLAVAKEGVPIQAEIEQDKGKVVYSVDIAVGSKVRSILLDVQDGKALENDLDDEDFSAVTAAARITLAAAIEAAVQATPGKPVFAALSVKDGKPEASVHVLAQGNVTAIAVDGVSGKVTVRPAAQDGKQDAKKDDPPFTETFGEDSKDFASTGTNPFFILEIGYTLILEGKKDGKDARITITVLDKTKKIDGVEARAVEEREEVGGQLAEVTLDYFALSRRTNNVYYFGEDVDVYKDGKVVNHEGAWLSGEKGARYGLFLPATPLLGARYYQEIAPGVAMDRAEVVGLTETFECPAGKFENTLKTEETTPLEKGERENKVYARGVGLLFDGGLRLTKYGKGAK